jgi:hypothetical protein
VEHGKARYEALKQSERLKRVKNVMESRKCMYVWSNMQTTIRVYIKIDENECKM